MNTCFCLSCDIFYDQPYNHMQAVLGLPDPETQDLVKCKEILEEAS